MKNTILARLVGLIEEKWGPSGDSTPQDSDKAAEILKLICGHPSCRFDDIYIDFDHSRVDKIVLNFKLEGDAGDADAHKYKCVVRPGWNGPEIYVLGYGDSNFVQVLQEFWAEILLTELN